MRFKCLSLLVLLSPKIYAQENLISNSGFEEYNGPSATIDDISKAFPWTGINTADHFNSGTTGKNKSRIESLSVNAFKPHSGIGYAGLRFQSDYNEFLQIKTNQKLKKGATYRILMYISLSKESGHKINSIGIYFSENQRVKRTVFGAKAHVVHYNPEGITTPDEWLIIEKEYIANGDENYVIIGNFNSNDPKNLVKKNTPNTMNEQLDSWVESYYYFDDISLTEVLPQASNQLEISYNQPITLENILFENGKTSLLKESNNELDKLVKKLQEKTNISIHITGHTDNSGDEKTNLILSEKRAQSVMFYLESKGIEKNRISYEGKGSISPIYENDTEEGRTKNRRVEILFKH